MYSDVPEQPQLDRTFASTSNLPTLAPRTILSSRSELARYHPYKTAVCKPIISVEATSDIGGYTPMSQGLDDVFIPLQCLDNTFRKQ